MTSECLISILCQTLTKGALVFKLLQLVANSGWITMSLSFLICKTEKFYITYLTR